MTSEFSDHYHLLNNPEHFFEICDKNKDGLVEAEELKSAMKNQNYPVTQKLIDLITISCNGNNSTKIKREDFIEYCKIQMKIFVKIFDSLDSNNDGFVHRSEIIPTLKKLDYNLKEGEIDDLLDKMDIDKDKLISFSEFVNFYHLIPINNMHNAFDILLTDWPDFDDIGLSPNFIHHGKETSAAAIILAGGISGAVSRTLTAPLDRLKIIMQASTKKEGLWKSFTNIYKHEGIYAYFKGNGTNVAKIIPETAIKFLLFDRIKKIVQDDKGKISLKGQMISGALAGLTSQTLIYPFEITKTRMALATKDYYHGISHCINSIIKKEGPLALYKGWSASAIGVAPYAAIDLTLFNMLKETYIEKVGESPSSVVVLSVGAVSGMIAQVLTYPFALSRTRLQSQGMPGREILYNGLFDCLNKTIKNEGVPCLFKGLVPNLMKSVPAISISYMLYEKMLKVIKTY